MWPKAYRDYKTDETLVKYPVEPSQGIIGCEMHDLNGWGESYHRYKKRKKGFLATLISYFSRT
jgi:hypothetical protein